MSYPLAFGILIGYSPYLARPFSLFNFFLYSEFYWRFVPLTLLLSSDVLLLLSFTPFLDTHGLLILIFILFALLDRSSIFFFYSIHIWDLFLCHFRHLVCEANSSFCSVLIWDLLFYVTLSFQLRGRIILSPSCALSSFGTCSSAIITSSARLVYFKIFLSLKSYVTFTSPTLHYMQDLFSYHLCLPYAVDLLVFFLYSIFASPTCARSVYFEPLFTLPYLSSSSSRRLESSLMTFVSFDLSPTSILFF